jgi:hypothetical protein
VSCAPQGTPVRLAAALLWRVVVVTAVVLLAGCQPASHGEDGRDGAPGADDTSGGHVVHGGDGGDGGDGWGGDGGWDGSGGAGRGGDGGDARDGADGEDGADGADGRPGLGYPGSGPVSGSGNPVTRRIDCPGVTTVLAGASFVVRVRIGAPEQAAIRMDDNLTGLVDAAVRGSALYLGLKPGANVRNATLSADVTVRHLDRLAAGGASQVILVSELTGPAVRFEASGASRITGAMRVDQATASASGASTVALSGQADRLDLRGAGLSVLWVPELTVRDLTAVLSGSSCAAATVRGTLAAQASGASTLRYRGTPVVTRRQTSGVSSIAAGPPQTGSGHPPFGDQCQV